MSHAPTDIGLVPSEWDGVLGRRQPALLWLFLPMVVLGLLAVVGGLSAHVASMTWTGVVLLAASACVVPLREPLGPPHLVGGRLLFRAHGWRAVRASVPGLVALVAVAAFVGWRWVRAGHHVGLGLVAFVLVVLAALGAAASLVRTALKPTALVLAPEGVAARETAPLVPWDSITALNPQATVVGRRQRLSDDKGAFVEARFTEADGSPQLLMLRLDQRCQHPAAILAMLESYFDHPELRHELGTEVALRRASTYTDVVAEEEGRAGRSGGSSRSSLSEREASRPRG